MHGARAIQYRSSALIHVPCAAPAWFGALWWWKTLRPSLPDSSGREHGAESAPDRLGFLISQTCCGMGESIETLSEPLRSARKPRRPPAIDDILGLSGM